MGTLEDCGARVAGTRQSKANTVGFANPDQFDSQVHPGRKMFWGGACVYVEP